MENAVVLPILEGFSAFFVSMVLSRASAFRGVDIYDPTMLSYMIWHSRYDEILSNFLLETHDEILQCLSPVSRHRNLH